MQILNVRKNGNGSGVRQTVNAAIGSPTNGRSLHPEGKANAKSARRLRMSAAYKEPLPRNWRKTQVARQKGRCVGCQRRFGNAVKATVDHIVPFAIGGMHEPSNCQLLCMSCNNRKRAMPEQEFQRRYFGRLL